MLIVSGGFFGKPWDLYQVQVKEVEFYRFLKDLPEGDGFFVFSYGLSEETVGVKVKGSDVPPVIYLRIGEVEKAEFFSGPVSLEALSLSLDKRGYVQRVRKIKKEIEKGTLYQMNLSTKIDASLRGEPLDLFLRFFQKQPTPYAFFLDLKDFYILSGSMELFLEKRGKKITSKPIKGTARNEKMLRESVKDRAENLMILDMMRNDLSKIAEVGSVKVEELFKVEKYTTLCQMHSTVSADIEKGFGEVLFHTFPPASVTGAPKRKAVEIIDLLEPHPRDYYCGCAGFKQGEDFTLSVLIRTAFGSGRKISYYAGSGIVYDSQEEREWEETLSKAKAFLFKKRGPRRVACEEEL